MPHDNSYYWGKPKKVDVSHAVRRGIQKAVLLLSMAKDQRISTFFTRLIQVLANEQSAMRRDPNVRDVSFVRIIPSTLARKRLCKVLGVESVGDLWKVQEPGHLREQLRRQHARDVFIAMHPASIALRTKKKKCQK